MTPEAAPTFHQWLKWAFEHAGETEWNSEWSHTSYTWESGRWLEQSPAVGLEFVSKLFENPLEYLSSYSDEQINEGLFFIVSTARSAHFYCLVEGDVDIALRRRCIRSIEVLTRELLAPRCSDNVWIYTKPLNHICDLLWDLVVYCSNSTDLNSNGALWGVRNPEIDEEVLDTLSHILAMPSVACQQSALHGLGHLVDFSGLGSSVIQQFLDDNPDLRSDLREYAQTALVGKVM
jgi:hypothetical protein